MDSPFPAPIAFVELAQPAGGAPALAPAEAAALGPASSPRRRAQFALGRACAREALRRLGAPESVTVGRAEGRLPAWPAGYVGSITHSHEHAAAAVGLAAAYRGLGIDLERVRLPSPGLLERVARPAERLRLDALPPVLLPIAFTALFAAKESLYKAVNPLTGVYLGFGDAEINLIADTDWSSGAGPFTWRLEKDSGPHFPLGASGVGAWRQQQEWVVAGIWINS